MKDFSYQWYIIKSVTNKLGEPVERDYPVYTSQPLCFGFHLEPYSDEKYRFNFNYYSIEYDELREYDWHTSSIQSIEDTENGFVVTTRNSIYTFEKSDKNAFEYYDEYVASKMN